MALAVIDRLKDARELDNAHLDVHVEGGVVTLRGTVEDHHAGWTAREIAAHTRGVVDARVMLTVRPEWGEERAPLATEFQDRESTEAMSSPSFRLVDSL